MIAFLDGIVFSSLEDTINKATSYLYNTFSILAHIYTVIRASLIMLWPTEGHLKYVCNFQPLRLNIWLNLLYLRCTGKSNISVIHILWFHDYIRCQCLSSNNCLHVRYVRVNADTFGSLLDILFIKYWLGYV